MREAMSPRHFFFPHAARLRCLRIAITVANNAGQLNAFAPFELSPAVRHVHPPPAGSVQSVGVPTHSFARH